MYNWYDIIEPHQDIKDEEFSMSVFAADLGDVISENAPLDYTDPDMFSRKTYFTEGLTKLLKRVEKKLTHGKGDSIIELKTPFGGGKTHSLISIYHYIKNGKKIKKLLPKDLNIIEANIAVLPCDHFNPQQGRKTNKINIRTLWGELAYRLGGKEGYKEFEEDDKNRVAPGKDKLREFLSEHQPFVLLFDEVLEYIAGALGVEYSKTNLGSQTFTFLTQLTKAVGSLDKGLLVVTLPSSKLEDFTPKKEEGLARLDRIFMRIETIETTVEKEEIYSIIRRRLFQNIKQPDKKDEIIHKYFEYYRKNKDDIPKKVIEKEYKKKINLSYPFHPETIDLLREKWGTFSSFQRTRGVLRLLATVIGDLYQKEKNIDLILPSDINLSNPSTKQEFIKHIGNEYDGIISSDITGKSKDLDRENREWKHLAEKISTAIFLYSFTAQDRKKGIDLPYIKLSTLRPEIMPSMITEIREKLTEHLWYLNQKDGKYYFSRIPNLNRMKRDKKELYKKPKVLDQMEEIVKKEIGKEFKSYLWPKKSKDIPDNPEIKLVILHPEFDENKIDKWINKRNNGFRTYKNTLIFAIAELSGYAEIQEKIKELLAFQEIKREITTGKNKTLKEKLPDIKKEIKQIKKDFSYNVRKTYKNIRVKDEKIDLGMPITGKESLSSWYKRELENKEEIITHLHYRPIVKKFLQERERISTKKILDQYYKNRDLSMLQSEEVLIRALQKGIETGDLALAILDEDKNISKNTFIFNVRPEKEDITFEENEYLFSKKYCEQITCPECHSLLVDGKCPQCETEPTQKTDTHKIKEKQKKYEEEETKKKEKTEKKYRKIKLKISDVSSNKILDLSRGVLNPISQDIGEFNLEIYIDIDDEEGIKETTLENTVKETIKQIGAKIEEEEKKE